MERVKLAVARGVMTVTLADLESRNALGAELVGELQAALARANADSSVRVVILTNEGSTFCAGANLKEQSARNESGESTAIPDFSRVLVAIQQSATPVVGRIDGHVVGGGNGLAAACDIAIARDDVKFGFTEVRLGVTPAIVSVVCLPKMRRGEAMEAFLRGNRFSAGQAADYGLISRAVPSDQLDAAIGEVVEDIRKGGPSALAIAKRLVYELERRDPGEALEWATSLSAECFASEEAREGMQAFLEKRAAGWAASE